MKKTIGQYTIKLNPNSNLLTVTKGHEMVYGQAHSPANSGSAFTAMCTKVTNKVSGTHTS